MKGAMLTIAMGAALATAGCGELSPIEAAGELRGPEIKVEVRDGPQPTGLDYIPLREGRGREAKAGDMVTIQFSGISYDGRPLGSSWEYGSPFRFELGAGYVSPGWEDGIAGMQVGGRRELLIPGYLTSKELRRPGEAPRVAHLYIVDLLAIE